MLGSMLEKIVSPWSGCTENPQEFIKMQDLKRSIKSYEITSVQELLSHPWLRCSLASEAADQDALRNLTLSLFDPQVTMSGDARDDTNDMSDRFAPTVNFVNTGKGFWRVFNVDSSDLDVKVGDEIYAIGKEKPPNLKDKMLPCHFLTGNFYSEVKLEIKSAGSSERRQVIVRRKRLVPSFVSDPDSERFLTSIRASKVGISFYINTTGYIDFQKIRDAYLK